MRDFFCVWEKFLLRDFLREQILKGEREQNSKRERAKSLGINFFIFSERIFRVNKILRERIFSKRAKLLNKQRDDSKKRRFLYEKDILREIFYSVSKPLNLLKTSFYYKVTILIPPKMRFY